MPERFDQCTETCTTDCGHCKGRPVEALRADNERLSRRLAGRFEETEHLRAEIERLGEHERMRAQIIADHQSRLIAADSALAEVASLRQQLAVCSCGSSPMTYEGPEPDCPVHGAVRAFNEANAEIAGLRQQLDEARGERDDLWRRFNSSQDSNKTLAAMAREELDLRTAAEADNARLLDVYRAAEAWREWIIARAESIGPDEHALASKLDAYRAGAPAEAPDGERA